MRTGNRLAWIVSVVLISSSVVAVAQSGFAQAANFGALAHRASSSQSSSVTLGGAVYFTANDSIHGSEL